MSRELPIGQTIASSWIVLFAIVFYAELVYPHLYQMWGGGHPTPVAVATVDQETHKVSSLVRGQLLDEDSSGIYLQFNDQTAAVFVPKGEISRICFLERTQVHSLTELILPQMLAGRRASAGVSGCTP
jgi:hypothetical protein